MNVIKEVDLSIINTAVFPHLVVRTRPFMYIEGIKKLPIHYCSVFSIS